MLRAASRSSTPTCSPSAPMTRTRGTRISVFLRLDFSVAITNPPEYLLNQYFAHDVQAAPGTRDSGREFYRQIRVRATRILDLQGFVTPSGYRAAVLQRRRATSAPDPRRRACVRIPGSALFRDRQRPAGTAPFARCARESCN